MYGNAPKALWSRWSTPDERNRIDLACRALLIEDGDRLILCEVGIGAFFEPKLRERYGIQGEEHVLLTNLSKLGISDADITDVVLSHLHFDHAGGLFPAFDGAPPSRLLFPNARYIVGKRAFERAKSPHKRDRASFIPELPGLLEASGRLLIVDGDTPSPLGAKFRFHFSEGHTPGLMLLEAIGSDASVIFMGDLVPGVPWVHVPITMGHDRYPEMIIDEKTQILGGLAKSGGYAFFTHDPSCAMAKIVQNDRGRFHTVDELELLSGYAF